jgi:sterol desaturase/sphingolipid hydroxylase (fatty acid hydroxylase superfamily)
MVNFEMALGNLLLIAFVILEVLILKFYLKKELPWKELIINLNSGHIVLWLFRGLEVLGYYYTFNNLSLELLDTIPYGLTWLIGFILWDFLFYWLHRTHHLFKILWSIHVVHHEGEHFSLSLGIRNSWYSSLSSLPYFIGMAIIGFPLEVFISVSSIHYFIQFYNHNHLVKKSGWLEYIMVTPSHHRVHHGKNDPYLDKNFGGTLVIWDKLFGTFQAELESNPVEFGTKDPIKSKNPILINNIPFIKLFKSDRVLTKKQENKSIPNLFLILGTLLLFAQLLCFIYIENILDTSTKTYLFLIIFLGTLAIGFLSDNYSRIGLLIWGISTLIFPFIILQTNLHFYTVLNTLLYGSIIHGVISFVWKIASSKKLKSIL